MDFCAYVIASNAPNSSKLVQIGAITVTHLSALSNTGANGHCRIATLPKQLGSLGKMAEG